MNLKPLKTSFSLKKSLHVAGIVASFSLLGCKDSPTPTASKQSSSYNSDRNANADMSKALFSQLSSKNLGDPSIDVKYLPGKGISVHPGLKPTVVTFDISKLGTNSLLLKASILPLPNEALKEDGAGVVGVEVFVDDKSLGRKLVDRTHSLIEPLQLRGAKSMMVRVDNANNNPRWDWCVISVE